MNVSQKLRELADSIEQSIELPKFAPEDVDLPTAIKFLRQHTDIFDIDISLRIDGAQKPGVSFIIWPRGETIGKHLSADTLAGAVNLTIAHFATAGTPPADPVAAVEAALAPMVKDELTPF